MRKSFYLIAVLALTVGLLAACGGSAPASSSAPAASAGSAEAGKKLFAQSVIGALPGCVTCHSLEAGKTLVGPAIAGIAARAGSTVSGKSADEYLRQSILEPDAYVAKGFTKGIMQPYQKELNDGQIKDLIAYLLTLK